MKRNNVRGGFTLVELLTVIAIITLLIGILIPAVNAVRKNARQTSTRSSIASLEAAIASFQADQRVGGGLPPSASDTPGGGGGYPTTYTAANPYEKLSVGGKQVRVTGGGLLVWALAGADLLGTPGFRTFRPTSSYWSQDTGFGTAADPGAYYLDAATNQPKFERAGPYVDLSKVRVSRFNDAAKSFDIEAELEARERSPSPPGGKVVKRNYPLFLDGYGFPILYWRADPAGEGIADAVPAGAKLTAGGGGPVAYGIYHYADNSPLIGPIPGEKGAIGGTAPLVLRPTAATQDDKVHKLIWKTDPPKSPTPAELAKGFVNGGFWNYIRNREIAARLSPHKPDAYILVSAGEDGIYGTGDDVANFPHNGAEVARDP